jgi:hypothetical protein
VDYVEEVVAAVLEAQEILDTTAGEATIETKIKKRGLFSKIKGFYDELTDENSDLYKNTAKLRNGAQKLQSALKLYNDVVRMIPVLKAILPEVPAAVLNLGKTK